MPTETQPGNTEKSLTFTESSLVAALKNVQALHEMGCELIAGVVFQQASDQHQGEPAACAHEWTDDGEFLLVCTKCGIEEDHEPYGWVQTRGPEINRFTQEWDIVQEWEDQGFEYKAMHEHPASAEPRPVEFDEHAEFERWWHSTRAGERSPFAAASSAWIARADLERKP